ncbi:MAG: type II secretion system F family protein [Actinomycetota bacterium]|jgi:tight adherence protein B|nr:type II secretion system F family protein [Acidothermales bacterium]MDQ3431313.1 type II secretion system F family protein [Actinomycetota bacterium]
MGAFVGLLFGLGLLLMWQSRRPRPARPPRTRPGWRERTAERLAQAGIEAVTPAGLVASSVGLAVFVFLLAVAVSRSPSIALAFGLIAGFSPSALVRYRQRLRRAELRELWPEVVDNLGSAVRAGLSLPEALTQVGVRGPEALRRQFQRFGEDYRATGRFGECLDRLKTALADPVADRIVESLRLAREVGGSDLGRLLRTLSAFLREDARTRAELETRQSWTVNAARLAVASPWLLLGLLSLRPEAVRAYNTGSGVVVLAVGGAVSFIAYRVMVRIGRLPEEDRVLR